MICGLPVYADDMLHPSAVAEDYIWDKFARYVFPIADFGRFRDWAVAVRQARLPLAARSWRVTGNTVSSLISRAKLEQLSLRLQIAPGRGCSSCARQPAALPSFSA
jgi:hypothetical protein